MLVCCSLLAAAILLETSLIFHRNVPWLDVWCELLFIVSFIVSISFCNVWLFSWTAWNICIIDCSISFIWSLSFFSSTICCCSWDVVVDSWTVSSCKQETLSTSVWTASRISVEPSPLPSVAHSLVGSTSCTWHWSLIGSSWRSCSIVNS